MIVSYLFPHHMIGFSDSLGDYNVNCCHTDVSLFVRISILEYVRGSFPPPRLFVLIILGQRRGSSQKTLPTSGRTGVQTDNTSIAHAQHSIPQVNRSGSNMDEKSLGKLHGPTVGPVGEHVETGAEK